MQHVKMNSLCKSTILGAKDSISSHKILSKSKVRKCVTVIFCARSNPEDIRKHMLREMNDLQVSVLVSNRCAASFHRLLQVVVVGENLHEEVELQSLRL